MASYLPLLKTLKRTELEQKNVFLCLRNHLAAGWTSDFYRGANRLSANARPPSSPKCTTSSPNLGARSIRLASTPLLQPLSHPLTALKSEHKSICLLWMSLWPHISARPRLLDRVSGWTGGFSAALDGCASGLSSQDAHQRVFRSGFCLAQGPEKRNRPGSACHQSHSTRDWTLYVQPHRIGAPPLAHDEGDERGR